MRRGAAIALTRSALRLITAGDIRVTDYEVVPGQEPDGLDDDFASDVAVTFTVGGETLARLLGKQQRVAEKALSKIDRRKAIALIGNLNAGKLIMPSLYKYVKGALVKVGRDLGKRGVKIAPYPRGISFTENTSHWDAKIAKDSIEFTVELGVVGNWID